MQKEIKPKTGESEKDKQKRIEEDNLKVAAGYVAYLIKKYKLNKQ